MEPGDQPARPTSVRPLLLAFAFLVASACGGSAANRAADITGFVTSVSGRTDGVTVLVESDPTFRDLVPGLQVEVWFDEPVATSYPVQGKAQALVIVR